MGNRVHETLSVGGAHVVSEFLSESTDWKSAQLSPPERQRYEHRPNASATVAA
jgi:hypothetical protein